MFIAEYTEPLSGIPDGLLATVFTDFMLTLRTDGALVEEPAEAFPAAGARFIRVTACLDHTF